MNIHNEIAADPQTLDPLFAHADANSVEQQLARLAFEPFIDIDAHGRAIPILLARIPTVANGDLSRDGRTIVYHLRRGDRVARAERIDDYTVRVVLKAPWAPAVATLFSYGTAPQYVLPAHLLAKEPRLDRAAFAGEIMGNWLWLILWPDTAGTLLIEPLELRDLRDPGQELDLPFGARSPRLPG